MKFPKDPATNPEVPDDDHEVPGADSSAEGGEDDARDNTTADPQAEEDDAETPEDAPEGEDGEGDDSDSHESDDGAEGPDDEGGDDDREAGGDPESEDDSDVVMPGDEQKPPKNKSWARLRRTAEKAKAEAAEYKRQLEALKNPQAADEDPGPEPTEESCGWDGDVLKAKYKEWLEKVAKRDARKAEQAKKAQESERHANTVRAKYRESCEELVSKHGVPKDRFEQAEKEVISQLSDEKQAILLKVVGPEKAPMVVHFLGRRPEELDKLVAETDRDSYVSRLAELKVGVQVKKGNKGSGNSNKGTPTRPKPEAPLRGGGGGSGSGSTTLERLRAKAEETGDYTEVIRYQEREEARRSSQRR